MPEMYFGAEVLHKCYKIDTINNNDNIINTSNTYHDSVNGII